MGNFSSIGLLCDVIDIQEVERVGAVSLSVGVSK
jgi:hypothetical protein